MTARSGAVLAGGGDYELGAELARGRATSIVSARDRRHDRVVALKRPLGPGGGARFAREARLAARLQHRGIVPLYEAGHLPAGEPFLAMKRVEGRTLAEVTRESGGPADRLALLPRIIAVADTLAYAHEQGVAHGAVGPDHVLCGRHGETLLIGWGRAEEDAPPAAIAADLRALGVLLGDTLSRDAPAELASVVRRATGGGYAGAAEIAADLGRFVTGQLVAAHRYSTAALLRRWARRRRAMLIAAAVVAAAGVYALTRVDRQRDEAVAAQREAERVDAGGEELVGFVLERVYDELRSTRRMDLLGGIADEVMRYYRALEGGATDARGLDRRVFTLKSLSEVERDRGDPGKQAALLGAGLALLDERARRFGSDARLLETRAMLETGLARYPEAIGAAAAAQVADPASAVAAYLVLNAEALGSGQRADARRELLDLREQAVRASRRFPASAEIEKMIGWCDRQLGRNDLAQDRVDEAERRAEDAVLELRAVLARDPGNLYFASELARAHILLGDVASRQERAAGAHYAAVTPLLAAAVAADPRNAEQAFILAEGQRGECAAARAPDRCHAALATLAPHAGSARHRAAMARTRVSLARALETAGRLDEARAAARAAVLDYDVALARSPQPMWIVLRGRARMALALLDPSAENLAAARATPAELEDVMRRFPANRALRRNAAEAYLSLGSVEVRAK